MDGKARAKILERLSRIGPPNRLNRYLARYTALAACAAAVMFCVFLPGLLAGPLGLTSPDEQSQNGPRATAGPGQHPAEVRWDNGSAFTVIDPARPAIDIHPVTFNTGGNAMSVTPSARSGHGYGFFYDLTDAQHDAVFPDLYMILRAQAHYQPDGTLRQVTAYVGDHKFIVQAAEGAVARTLLIWHNNPPVVSMVHGTEVTANYTGNYHEAEFMLGDIAYLIVLYDGGEYQVELMEEIVNRLVLGGPADLSVLADPVIPELRNDLLTIEEAYADPGFGAYLPPRSSIPPQFLFESAHRYLTQQQNGLLVHWNNGHLGRYDNIRWQIEDVTDWHRERLVSPEEREKYDMALYPIPWMDSMPEEIWQVAMNPVFRAEDLTLDILLARTQVYGGREAAGGQTVIMFGILFDDGIAVEIHTTGISPELLWEMLAGK
jgi:hypothetical protein